MNVLYVTTRQWNPGDEFIMAGVRRVVERAFGKPAIEAIYNKSPQLRGYFDRWNPFRVAAMPRGAGVVDSVLKIAEFDNSFGWRHDLDAFDRVFFCGSPGWFGGRLTDLYNKLPGFQGKVALLGIGSPNRQVKLSPTELSVMQAATVTCRNDELVNTLRGLSIDCQYIPCPALLSADEPKEIDRVQTIGFVYTSDKGHRYQRVSAKHYALQQAAFKSVQQQHDDWFVACHYIDEVPEAVKLYGRDRVRYVFDAGEYQRLLAEADLIVSSRVHGCGMASSLGIPNVHLGHDKRASTADGFLSRQATSAEETLAAVAELTDNAAEESRRLIAHREAVLDQYVGVLTGTSAPATPPLQTA